MSIFSVEAVKNETQPKSWHNIDNIYYVFQPIYDYAYGHKRIYGYEALIRSRDTNISSESLIGHMHHQSLHHELWIDLLDKTFSTYSQKLQDGEILSINACNSFILAPWFCESIEEALQKHQISPSLIMIEITESLPDTDSKETSNTIMRLKQIGIKFALDDFGAGHSNLQAMMNLPIDCIKLDGSLVDGMAESKAKVAIESVVAIAKKIGFTLVAEKVETRMQADMLQALGITRMQGYYFSKPICL